MKRLYFGIVLALLIVSVPMFEVGMTRTKSGVKVQSGPTYVSGIITENTTWTLDCSPYILVADVAVDIDVFLTIEPGVTVEFTNGTNLIVDGCLIARGNSTNRITFTSNSTNPASGDWGTVNIRHYSVGGNIFEYTLVEYASTALTLAADCNITASTFEYNNNGISLQNATNVSVKNAKITNNAGGGIGGSISQSMEIQSSNVSMNGAGASVSSGREDGWPPVHIKNSTFDGNTGNGVGFGNVDPEIDNCSISGNGGNGVGTSGQWEVHLQLWNSNVSNNMGTGVAGSVGQWSQSFIDVQNCTFWNNTIGMAILGSATNCDINGSSQYGVCVPQGNDYSGELSLYKCTISNSGLDGIKIGYRTGCSVSECDISNNKNGVNLVEPWSGVGIYDSTIRNNSNCGIIAAWGGPSLQDSLIEQSQYGIYVRGGASVTGCTIRDTVVGINSSSLAATSTTIANNTLANIQTGSCTLQYCNVYNSTTNIQCDSGTLEYCNVYNGTLGVKLGSGTINYCNIFNNTEYNVQDTSSNDVNATYNWWGTTNETLIRQYIHDYYDDPANLGRVFYNPFMTVPVDTEKDIVPPVISGISATPSIPNYDQSVVVSATIVDNVAVDQALLSYTSEMTWYNVSTSKFGDVFNATIPVQSWNTTVQYRIYANDTSGNWAESATYSYTIEDFVPPSIVTVNWKPTNPWPYVPSNVTRTNEPTLITANVTEPINASGTQGVMLCYEVDAGGWWNTTMTYNATTQLWIQTIPGQPNSTNTVEFFIQAYDNVGNMNTSSIYNYQINHLLLGDVNGDGKVDMRDIGTVARHFGEHYP